VLLISFRRLFIGLLVLFCCSLALAEDDVSDPSRLSGFFFDPSHDGEGFVIDVLPTGGVTVYWFTYDSEGNQRWFLGVGQFDDHSIHVDEWIVTSGGRFGEEFVSEDVEFSVAGDADFVINDCDHMTVNYTIDGNPGQQQLQRLSGLADASCNGIRSHRSGLGGAFYDPQRNGEGIVLHVIDERRALLVFFGYDQHGEQMWVLGDGEIEGDELVFQAPFSTRGGRFGPDFNPDDVVQLPWGGMRLSLACDSNDFFYQALDPELGTGQLNLERLSGQAGVLCDEGSTFELPKLSCNEYQRELLTSGYLSGGSLNRIIPNQELTPAADCAPALHQFQGELHITGGSYRISGADGNSQSTFPDLRVDFTSVEDRIVSINPDLIRSRTNNEWRYVFGTGQSWSEPGDDGWSRAAIPFTMSHFQWNAARHGLFSFLYRENEISRVQFQVTQENIPWEDDLDYYGRLDARFTTAEPEKAYVSERAWRRDMAMRFETAPWPDLPDIVNSFALIDFNRDVPEHKLSQAGVLLDDMLYLQPAFTRSGTHPYPEEMRHGAFSVSKTAGGAVALLYLAQAYGPEVYDELIRDHINVTASHNGWDNVTFGDTLSMVTGVGDAAPFPTADATFADENADSNPNWQTFNYSSFLNDRLEGAFGFGNFPWGPAEVMRYNSAHTMILGVALDNYLKSKEGPDADLWNTLNREVFQPIGIRWLPSMRLNIDAETPGPVPMGWGLVLSIHDAARVAELLQNDGEFNGQQLLHREMTRRTMRKDLDFAWRTSAWTQLRIDRWVPTQYLYGTWSSGVSVSPGCQLIGSRMEGLGGNFVVMMPSGVNLFRFADADVYDPGALMVTGERIRSSCSP